MKKLSLTLVALFLANFIQAEIAPITGANTVGFVPLTVPAAANTIITVPFEACLGEGLSGVLADLVATNGLTHSTDAAEADQLVVLTTNNADLVYYYYYNKTGDGWTPINTVKVVDGVEVEAVTPSAADEFALSRGLGFWLKRVAGSEGTLYLKGQVADADQVTPIKPGLNLIGYSALAEFTLNSKNWEGAYGSPDGDTSKSDRIIVANANGSFSTYYYFVKPDNPAWDAYASLDGKWITAGFALASTPITAGRGFWYRRAVAQSAFNFEPDSN